MEIQNCPTPESNVVFDVGRKLMQLPAILQKSKPKDKTVKTVTPQSEEEYDGEEYRGETERIAQKRHSFRNQRKSGRRVAVGDKETERGFNAPTSTAVSKRE